MSDDRFVELESKLAFQERTIEQLNEVVVAQQKQLDTLTAQVESLRKRLKSMADDGGEEEIVDLPPPHY